MSLKEFIQGFATTAKNYIEKFELYNELTGEQKKARVDELVTIYCNNALDKLPLNIAFKWVFKKLLIPNIPHITQIIFDLIASKIEGITK